MNEDPLLESGLTKLSNASGVSYLISFYLRLGLHHFMLHLSFQICLKWNLNCKFSPYSKLKKLFHVNTELYIEHRYEQIGGIDTCNQLSTEAYSLSE